MFTNLVVQNLPNDITETQMRDIFAKFGEITSSKLKEGEGKGFISFKTHDSAQRAVDELNMKHKVGGQAIIVAKFIPKSELDSRINMANPISQNMKKLYQNNIFVMNIPPVVSEEEARKVFEESEGDIISLKFKPIFRQGYPRDESNMISKSAYILYKDNKTAQRCIQLHDNQLPFGPGLGFKPLRVDFWKTKTDIMEEKKE